MVTTKNVLILLTFFKYEDREKKRVRAKVFAISLGKK
jgi:hypothetical protein